MTNNVESYPLSGKELKSIVPVRTNGGIFNISPDYWFQEHFYRWQRTEFCIFLYILNTEHTPPAIAILPELYSRPSEAAAVRFWAMLANNRHKTRENRKLSSSTRRREQVSKQDLASTLFFVAVLVSWHHAILRQIHHLTRRKKLLSSQRG